MSIQILPIHTGAPAKAFGQLIKTEAKLALRVPLGLALGFFVPVLLLVILGAVPGMHRPYSATSSLTLMGVYIPVLIGMVLTLVALVSLPIPLVLNRERGWLRRFSTTPVPPSWLLSAQVIVNLVIVLMAIAVIVGGGVLFFGVQAPAQPFGFLLALVLAIAALFAMGLLICAIAPSPQAAGVLGTVLLYPLLFFGGLWTSRESMSTLLQTIGDYTPLAAAAQAMQDAMIGNFPTLRALLVMAAYALVFGIAAVRFFRWE